LIHFSKGTIICGHIRVITQLVVGCRDVALIRNAVQKIGVPLIIGWCDLDGNGAVDMTDFFSSLQAPGDASALNRCPSLQPSAGGTLAAGRGAVHLNRARVAPDRDFGTRSFYGSLAHRQDADADCLKAEESTGVKPG
jgi:hypothetical protein